MTTTKLGRAHGTKNGGEELVDAMREAGFLRVDEAATRLKLSPQTVRLWAKDKGVASRIVAHSQFVRWEDCVRKYGVENALLLNIIDEKSAAKLRTKGES